MSLNENMCKVANEQSKQYLPSKYTYIKNLVNNTDNCFAIFLTYYFFDKQLFVLILPIQFFSFNIESLKKHRVSCRY